jgi:hypothetical protein
MAKISNILMFNGIIKGDNSFHQNKLKAKETLF